MHFQRVLSILFLIVLLFSFSVPAFADENIKIEEGYNVYCVPYSPYISSLVVTDNTEEASVYYSASKARTYSATVSPFSGSVTSDTSDNNLYYFSDFLALFSRKASWKPWKTSYYEYPVLNGKSGLKILSGDDTTLNFSSISELPLIKTGNKYSFSFTIYQQALTRGTMYLRFYDSLDSTKFVDLFNMTATAQGSALKVNKTIAGNFVVPDDWTGSVNIKFVIENMVGSQPTIYINDFTVVDITNENLDNSLDKFGDKLENAGSDEPPLDTDISAFQSAIDTMNGWLDQLDEFADSIDAAGQTANEYISKGTEIFNGFMSVAPAAVIALVAFGVVFIVVRKIVGR